MKKEDLSVGLAFVIHDFLMPQECAAYVAFSEQQGYEDASINIGGANAVVQDYRNNRRVMVDAADAAAKLFERARPALPPVLWFDGVERTAAGLNERFRFYRYDPGQSFEPHYDGSFRRNEREESLLTFMVYLNEDFTGGTTDFYEQENTPRLRVKPRRGMALVFRHEMFHAGAPVVSGRKYVLRSDVMYRLAD